MTSEAGDLVTHHARYWEAADKRQLLIKRCIACSEHFYYPRPACPFCAGRDTEWVVTQGYGVIYSFCLMRRKGEIVSAPAFVTLDEGPTILTALIVAAADSYHIGQRVAVTFAPTTEHENTPFFQPAESRTG